MKKTTITKYETSDGRTFTDEGDARTHELSVFVDSQREDGAARLTAAELLRFMAANPKKFADKLTELSA